MKTRSITVCMVIMSVLVFSRPAAQADQEWLDVGAGDEMRELLSGRMMDGTYWVFYFRPDGKMAYLQAQYATVRDWFVNEEGKLCMSVFGMPERVIECPDVKRHRNDPHRVLLKAKTGVFDVRLMEPSPEAISAIEEKAGPE